jgi:FKBP-type peptidyl-prolyl cis-trans isomerase (trigger factor)
MAERIIIRSLVLQKFGELEGVHVDLEEIRSEIEHLMEHASGDEIRQALSTPQARESVGRNLYMKKITDRLYTVITGQESVSEEEATALTAEKKEEEVKDGEPAE